MSGYSESRSSSETDLFYQLDKKRKKQRKHSKGKRDTELKTHTLEKEEFDQMINTYNTKNRFKMSAHLEQRPPDLHKTSFHKKASEPEPPQPSEMISKRRSPFYWNQLKYNHRPRQSVFVPPANIE